MFALLLTPWANLFCYNMFFDLKQLNLQFCTRMDCTLRTKFMADPAIDGTRQSNFAILDFTKK
jgi:phosphoenolpyruvate carboxykinase (ATP)